MDRPTEHATPLGGTCQALVVVDPGGLSLADLRATDPRSVTVAELQALTTGRPVPSGIVAPPVVQAAAPWDRVRIPSPVVLRVQGGAILAWSEAGGGYVALGPDDLRVLEAAPDGRRVDELAGPDVAARIGMLATLGVVEVEAGEVPAAPTVAGPAEAAQDVFLSLVVGKGYGAEFGHGRPPSRSSAIHQ